MLSLLSARAVLIDGAAETLNKAHRMKDLTEIVAPASGTILEVADRPVGSVLREAETLLTLVPQGADLYVEAQMPSRDVGYVKVGDEVRVKLEAHPFQRFGTLNGVLDVVSADSLPAKQDDPQSQRIYPLQVRITDNLGALAAEGIRVRSGLSPAPRSRPASAPSPLMCWARSCAPPMKACASLERDVLQRFCRIGQPFKDSALPLTVPATRQSGPIEQGRKGLLWDRPRQARMRAGSRSQ